MSNDSFAAGSADNFKNDGSATDGGSAGLADKKMFFTTSDLIKRMNSAMTSADPNENDSDRPGFELQRKMPDGSYRRAEESEVAAADFQAKLKQAAEMTANLSSRQKIEWANHQRQKGNELVSNGDYKEAMDVYLTCLVAMDTSKASSNTSDAVDPSSKSQTIEIEKGIQLPVLLNLALCAMKMGTLSKGEKFCNYAIDLESGKTSVKAYFRRGKIRMLMGNYISAELDLDKALDLHNGKFADTSIDNFDVNDNEKKVILREKQKLLRLVKEAEKNKRRQKKAMKNALRGGAILYPEKKEPMITTNLQNDQTNMDVDEELDLTCFEWYIRMIGRGAQKMLDMLGNEEEEETWNSGKDATTAKKNQ